MRALVLLFSCLFLTSCMDAAMSSANALYDHHSVEGKLQNHYIQIAVLNTIKNDPQIGQPSDIGVTTMGKVALLTGQTPDYKSQQQAAVDAKTNPAIKIVLNYIDVSPPLTKSQQLEDTWLTAKIKTKIITGNELDPDDVKIITDNNVVYLMGFLPRQEAEAAIRNARSTDGVTKVVTVIYFLDASTA